MLYERHFTSELSSGIISLQFKTCNFHGFDKNALVVASKDSSVIALEIETGNTISANPIRSKKPSRALFMHILGNILMFLGIFLVYSWKVLLHMAGHKMSSNFFISFSFLKFLQRGKMLPEDLLLQIKLK